MLQDRFSTPSDATQRDTNHNVRRRRAFTFLELLTVLIIIVILISILLPAVQQAREAARRTQCRNNLTQIGIAFASYQQVHSMLPPGCVSRPEMTGRPEEPFRLSWVVQLMPYLDQKGVYQQINFSQPELSFLTEQDIANRQEALQIQAELQTLLPQTSEAAETDGVDAVTNPAEQRETQDGADPAVASGSELTIAGRIMELETRLQELGYDNRSDLFSQSVQQLGNLDLQLSVLKCPSSPNREISYGGAHHSSQLPLSDQADGLLYVNSSESLTTIPDGAAQTILVGEHVALFAKGQSSSWMFAGAATLRNGGPMTSSGERAAMQNGSLVADFSGSSIEERMQYIQKLSDLGPFGSYHGFDQAHFLFADGSVKALSRSIDSRVLARMINRHDGF